MADLPIIQKTYDLLKWYLPIIGRMPRDTKFTLGDRLQGGLYDLLEGFIMARYERERLPVLQRMNARLDVVRFLTRLALEQHLISESRYEYASGLLTDIGQQLGNWIKQQRRRPVEVVHDVP